MFLYITSTLTTWFKLTDGEIIRESDLWSPARDPGRITAFFQCVHASQNVLFSSIWGSFPPVFVFALAYGSIRTHANSFLSMRTHPHHFLPNTPKHDVRGNFPGHSTHILVCDPINSPCLPWFCIAYAPCAPTHPCAPIPTHLNLFIPICTLHYM